MGYYKWLATKKTFEQAFTSWVLPQNYDINTELTKKKRGDNFPRYVYNALAPKLHLGTVSYMGF